MQMTKYKLGDLIIQRREKNNNYDVPIRGVSKEGFIRAKQQEADTSIYNVFYKYDFVFNPARMELNSIALNIEYEKALCSSLYEVFYVKDENIVLPEFLNLHIKRDEFARHCDYIGLGSAREYCRFANISEFEIELPPIAVQQEIVDADRQIKRRIRLNEQMVEKLEATAQALYRHTFVDNIDKQNLPQGWHLATLGEVGKIVSGATPKTEIPEYWSDNNNEGIAWISPADLSKQGTLYIARGNKSITNAGYNSCSTKMLPAGSMLFSSRAPIGLMAIAANEVCTNQGFKSIVLKEDYMREYLYMTLQNEKDIIAGEGSGSTFDEISAQTFKNYTITLPSNEVILVFHNQVEPIFHAINLKQQENIKLTELQSLFLAKMGK